MMKNAAIKLLRPFVPESIKKPRRLAKAKASSDAYWKSILADDGLFHWKDLRFDLRHDPNTLFIRDEILNGGEYDFFTNGPCVVLDIGMNIGDTPLFFARMPNVKKVYGFEPIRATFDWAVSNFALNPNYSSKISPTLAGVSDISGTIEIEMDYKDGTGGAAIEIVNAEHRKAIEGANYILKDKPAKLKQKIRVEGAVEIVRSILEKHPGETLVLKCDAEGAEWKIIPALSESGLLEKVQVLMLEYHFRSPEKILELLTNTGFVCFLRDHKLQKKAEIGNIYAVRCQNT